MKASTAARFTITAAIGIAIAVLAACRSGHGAASANAKPSNHVKIWDGKTIVLLAHLARTRVESGPVKRGDVIGIAGVSGAAGHRHVHVTVTKPMPGENARPLLTTPGFKGALPVRWRVAAGASRLVPVDELRCNDEIARAEPLIATGP